MHLAHRRIRGQALFGQPLVEPGERRREFRVLVAQPMHQLHGKGVRQGPVRTAGEDGRGRLGRTAADAEQSIRKAVGLATRGAARLRISWARRRKFSISTICRVIEAAQSSPMVAVESPDRR